MYCHDTNDLGSSRLWINILQDWAIINMVHQFECYLIWKITTTQVYRFYALVTFCYILVRIRLTFMHVLRIVHACIICNQSTIVCCIISNQTDNYYKWNYNVGTVSDCEALAWIMHGQSEIISSHVTATFFFYFQTRFHVSQCSSLHCLTVPSHHSYFSPFLFNTKTI